MRIALNAWFWDRLDTGSGQYTRRLVEHLTALDPSLEIERIPSGSGTRDRSSLHKVWFEQVTFTRACRRLGVDLAHVPYWAPPVAPSVPTVVTIHDLIPLLLREYRGGPLVRAYTALVATAAQSAALVLTDSQASRRDILAHLDLPAERVISIPLAADERFRPQPAPNEDQIRERYDLPSCYILYLGGFDGRKNVGTALKTYTWIGPVLGETCPLIVAGRLPERDTAFAPDPRRQARALELEQDWVHFTGAIEEAHKPVLYRGAVAFLFPSRYEGFGLPPLEALACGTPVVGSQAASLAEVVGDAGVLLDPDDAAGMAGALIQLAQDSDFHSRLSQRALAQAARFSWERTAQQTLTAYRRVLG